MAVVPIEPRSDGASSHQTNPRKEGFLPMALVDKDNGTELIQANVQEVKRALKEAHGVALFKVRMREDAADRTVLVKKVDMEADKKRITHLTLQQVEDTDVIRISVPLEMAGMPAAVEAREAVLERPNSRVRVRCAVSDVPASIPVSVADMKVGASITAKDLTLPAGVEVVSNADDVMFHVKAKPVPVVAEVAPVV